jgi:dihydroorotase
MLINDMAFFIVDSDSKLSCPGDLRAGDIYTHTFHGHKSTIADFDQNRLHPVVYQSQQNGVLFDVGHGQGSFSWKVSL